MRVLLLLAVGCTISGSERPVAPRPTADSMPSEVLDHQDPGADTSHNPESRVGGGGSLFSCNAPQSSAFGPTATPHYYTGCGGCTGGNEPSLLISVAIISYALRARRPRRRGDQRPK